MDNAKKIAALLKSVEHGSFSGAAEVMAYSPSAISRMISELEADWNLTLLDRGRHGVSLTPAGLDLFPYMQNIYGECLALQGKISEMNHLQAGKLRLGTFSSVATHVLPGVIQRYQRDYPNIDFEIMINSYTEIEQGLHKGRIDVGFLILPTLTKLDSQPLMRDRLLAVMPEDHPMAAAESFPAERIPDFPFMLLQQGAISEITRYFDAVRVSPDVRFTTIDDYAILSMVERGMGISVLPELIMRRAPYRVVKKELSPPAFRTIGFAVKDREKVPGMVGSFLRFIAV